MATRMLQVHHQPSYLLRLITLISLARDNQRKVSDSNIGSSAGYYRRRRHHRHRRRRRRRGAASLLGHLLTRSFIFVIVLSNMTADYVCSLGSVHPLNDLGGGGAEHRLSFPCL
jgi:hypothetical protein